MANYLPTTTKTKETLIFESGEKKPRQYKSSPIAERGFCSKCGTSLTYRLLAPQPAGQSRQSQLWQQPDNLGLGIRDLLLAGAQTGWYSGRAYSADRYRRRQLPRRSF